MGQKIIEGGIVPPIILEKFVCGRRNDIHIQKEKYLMR